MPIWHIIIWVSEIMEVNKQYSIIKSLKIIGFLTLFIHTGMYNLEGAAELVSAVRPRKLNSSPQTHCAQYLLQNLPIFEQIATSNDIKATFAQFSYSHKIYAKQYRDYVFQMIELANGQEGKLPVLPVAFYASMLACLDSDNFFNKRGETAYEYALVCNNKSAKQAFEKQAEIHKYSFYSFIFEELEIPCDKLSEGHMMLLEERLKQVNCNHQLFAGLYKNYLYTMIAGFRFPVSFYTHMAEELIAMANEKAYSIPFPLLAFAQKKDNPSAIEAFADIPLLEKLVKRKNNMLTDDGSAAPAQSAQQEALNTNDQEPSAFYHRNNMSMLLPMGVGAMYSPAVISADRDRASLSDSKKGTLLASFQGIATYFSFDQIKRMNKKKVVLMIYLVICCVFASKIGTKVFSWFRSAG